MGYGVETEHDMIGLSPFSIIPSPDLRKIFSYCLALDLASTLRL